MNTNQNELLRQAIESGIIDLAHVQEQMEMKKRNELLKKHPHEIWQGKDGKWRTYLPDESKGRVMKKRTTLSKLEDDIITYWRQHEQKEANPSIQTIYNEWNCSQPVKEQTKQRNDRTFKQCCGDIANSPIRDFTLLDIRDFMITAITKYNISYSAYRILRTMMYGIIDTAEERELIHYTSTDLKRKLHGKTNGLFKTTPKNDDDLVFLKHEVELLSTYFINNPTIKHLGLLLELKVGLRPFELPALRWENIENNIIHVKAGEAFYKDETTGKNVYFIQDFTKTPAGIRDVVIKNEWLWIIDKLRELNPNGEFVFEEKGKRIKQCQFDSRLNVVCKNLGIAQKSIGKMRKTYGSILLDDNKIPHKVVQAQMGHKDIRTTQRYYQKNRHTLNETISIINNVAGL